MHQDFYNVLLFKYVFRKNRYLFLFLAVCKLISITSNLTVPPHPTPLHYSLPFLFLSLLLLHFVFVIPLWKFLT